MVSVKRGRIICGIFGVISLLVFLITLFLINPDTPGSKLIFASSLGGGLVGILTGAGVKTEYSTAIGVSISTMLFLQLWGTFQIWTIPALIVFSILLIVSARNS